MRERRRGNGGASRHVEVADVVQRVCSRLCAGEARCRVVDLKVVSLALVVVSQ